MNLSTIIEEIFIQIGNTPWQEFVAIITAIVYLVLAARESIWCWFWGIISCSFWAYMTWFHYNLMFETLLQIFYVAISFYGIYSWKFGEKEEKKELRITSFSRQQNSLIILGGIVLSLLFGKLGADYTTAAATYLDAFTTVFSVITTFMVIYKKIDNWIYWFVINSANVYLYWGRGGYFFALLFVIYLIIGVLGWIRWRRQVS